MVLAASITDAIIPWRLVPPELLTTRNKRMIFIADAKDRRYAANSMAILVSANKKAGALESIKASTNKYRNPSKMAEIKIKKVCA